MKALSHLLDHTAKAGSQVMSHVAQLEATTNSDIAGIVFQLFSIPKRLFQFRNVIPTLEI